MNIKTLRNFDCEVCKSTLADRDGFLLTLAMYLNHIIYVVETTLNKGFIKKYNNK